MLEKKFHIKICRFCEMKEEYIDYGDEKKLRRFITDRGKIIPRRMSGVCAKHQRRLSTAIKRARQLSIVPFTVDLFK